MSRGGWAALSRGATGLSAVRDCGIFLSYSLTIFVHNKWHSSIVADRKHSSMYLPVAFRWVHTGIEPPFLL